MIGSVNATILVLESSFKPIAGDYDYDYDDDDDKIDLASDARIKYALNKPGLKHEENHQYGRDHLCRKRRQVSPAGFSFATSEIALDFERCW